jgi:ubiquitin carboxyl-terminal hydrolase 25/28
MPLVIQTEEQALKWLDSTYDGSVPLTDHGIIAMAASKIADRPDLADVCAGAIKVIADARNSSDLRAWLYRGDTSYDNAENDIAAAYSFFGLYARTETPNPEILKMHLDILIQEAPYRREEAHRHYEVIMKHLAEPQGHAADYDNPVGLSNMGNTCYLNCLLQYFYAIRPVRDIVLNFDEYKINTDAESYEEKYVEKEKISKAQTVKSQLCKHSRF